MAHLETAFTQQASASGTGAGPTSSGRTASKVRRTVVTRVHEAVKALALCHNVTPVYEENEEVEDFDIEADQHSQQKVTYQASSPDEVSMEAQALIDIVATGQGRKYLGIKYFFLVREKSGNFDFDQGKWKL